MEIEYMAREKTTGFYFKMSPEEWDMVEKRMAQTHIRNKSAYLRKMAIDGHVIMLDLETLNEISRLLRITSNNANQIAKRVNAGGHASRADIEHMNDQLTKIRADFGKLLSLLSGFDSADIGKFYMKPPTITNTVQKGA